MLFWQEIKEPLYILEYLERRKPSLQVDNLSLRRFSPVNYALPIQESVRCPYGNCQFETLSGTAMSSHQQNAKHPGWQGMASDPVNGPGSVRRKPAVLLFTNGTTCITICSGIPNLWHAQNAPSELGEEAFLPTTSRTLIQTTKSQVVTSSNKPIANFLNCKELFSIAFGWSP